MKERPNLNELSKEVFESNKAKGFHDTGASIETLLMLVVTELSEAVEAHRKNKRYDSAKYGSVLIYDYPGWESDDQKTQRIYEGGIKGCVEEELADVIIRLLDLAGLLGWKFNDDAMFKSTIENHTFPELMFKITKITTDFVHVKTESHGHHAFFIIWCIEKTSEILGIDIWFHVDLKLKYNATCENKHGKSY